MSVNGIIEYLYDYDENDQTYICKLSPNHYLDLFNKLDYYPIRKKEIDQNVVSYIETCSSDIPLKNKIKIEISLKEEKQDLDTEERAIKGIKNHFLYSLDSYKKSSHKVIRTSLLYLSFFFILTGITFWLNTYNFDLNDIFFKTLFEGLTIGSWVFLWEAILGFFVKNQDNYYYIKHYKRLINTEVYFDYY